MDDERQNKIDKLDKIYNEYYSNLIDLRKQLDQVISNFIEALKKESINEIRKKLKIDNGR